VAATLILSPKEEKRYHHNAAAYYNDMFSMLATVLLWIYWPSFNGAFGTPESQGRVITNTYLSLASSCIFAFILSRMFDGMCVASCCHIVNNCAEEGKKFDMVHIQNSTLAGGVAMGAAANMHIAPGGAISVGMAAALISVVGYYKLMPYLQHKIGLRGIVTYYICISNKRRHLRSSQFAWIARYSGGSSQHYRCCRCHQINLWARVRCCAAKGRDAGSVSIVCVSDRPTQYAYQIASLVVTIVISLATGAITGFIIKKIGPLISSDELLPSFVDEVYWHVPDDYTSETYNRPSSSRPRTPVFQPNSNKVAAVTSVHNTLIEANNYSWSLNESQQDDVIFKSNTYNNLTLFFHLCTGVPDNTTQTWLQYRILGKRSPLALIELIIHHPRFTANKHAVAIRAKCHP
jgi:ammonium transporter Rh